MKKGDYIQVKKPTIGHNVNGPAEIKKGQYKVVAVSVKSITIDYTGGYLENPYLRLAKNGQSKIYHLVED